MMHRLLQFTLDLFASEPVPERVPEGRLQAPAGKPLQPRNPRKPRTLPAPEPHIGRLSPDFFEQNHAPAHIPRVQDATKIIASESLDGAPFLPQTLQQALPPVAFHHPQASRQALLADVQVAYAFKRGKRRTIGFSVGPDGLQVSAPKWVPLYEVDKAVQEKSGWILKKLHETGERHRRLESARIDWKNGALVPFLGGQVVVVLDPRQAAGAVGEKRMRQPAGLPGDEGAPAPQDSCRALPVGLPQHATAEQIRDVAQAWLMRQARRLFTERLNHFAPQLGVTWQRLSLSSAGTRWGSANANGCIRLNWRLIHFKPAVIDYVVVHELSHLRVMDHSPRFWETVRSIVPDYTALRGQLKDEAVPRW